MRYLWHGESVGHDKFVQSVLYIFVTGIVASTCVYVYLLVLFLLLMCLEQIKLPAEGSDYFLRSNESNINQSTIKSFIWATPLLSGCEVEWWERQPGSGAALPRMGRVWSSYFCFSCVFSTYISATLPRGVQDVGVRKTTRRSRYSSGGRERSGDGKLVDSFIHESDVTSLFTSRPSSRHVPKRLRSILLLCST